MKRAAPARAAADTTYPCIRASGTAPVAGRTSPTRCYAIGACSSGSTCSGWSSTSRRGARGGGSGDCPDKSDELRRNCAKPLDSSAGAPYRVSSPGHYPGSVPPVTGRDLLAFTRSRQCLLEGEQPFSRKCGSAARRNAPTAYGADPGAGSPRGRKVSRASLCLGPGRHAIGPAAAPSAPFTSAL